MAANGQMSLTRLLVLSVCAVTFCAVTWGKPDLKLAEADGGFVDDKGLDLSDLDGSISTRDIRSMQGPDLVRNLASVMLRMYFKLAGELTIFGRRFQKPEEKEKWEPIRKSTRAHLDALGENVIKLRNKLLEEYGHHWRNNHQFEIKIGRMLKDGREHEHTVKAILELLKQEHVDLERVKNSVEALKLTAATEYPNYVRH